jgi:prepilin-type N-terminal cleavage/methylation domain-containing protein
MTKTKNLNSKIQKKASRGFTLIEVIISVAIFSLIAYGLIALVSYILTISKQQGGASADIDQSRKVVAQMVKEFRASQIGSNGAYPLDTAGNQQVIFYSNSDTDILIERIRYFLQNGKLWKGVTEYNGSTYPTSTEQTIVVQNDVVNSSTTPLFYYYDGNYSGVAPSSTPLSQPVNVTAVKFIGVNLQIVQKNGVKNTNYYSVTAGGAIRNLKTNLGQ